VPVLHPRHQQHPGDRPAKRQHHGGHERRDDRTGTHRSDLDEACSEAVDDALTRIAAENRPTS
jgi:hypothetical protein